MRYPTLKEVESATNVQLLEWRRFLRSPGISVYDKVADGDSTPQNSEEVRLHEAKILERVCSRLEELGGITPEISKRVGWTPR